MDFPSSQPTDQYTIYALVDPRNRLIYYVGQTRNPQKRLIGHLKRRHYPERKSAWIRSLKEKNQKPLLQVLEIVNDEALALTKEQEWIRHFVEQGMPLLNAQAQPKQGRGTVKPQIVPEPLIPLRQEVIMISGYPIAIVWLPGNRSAVPLNSLCAIFGIRPEGQARRIRRDQVLAEHLLSALVETVGGLQRVDVLITKAIPDWVMGFQLKRIAPEKRPLTLILKTAVEEWLTSLDRRFAAVSPASAAESRWLPGLNPAHLADLQALFRSLEETTGCTTLQLEQELVETFGTPTINAIPDEQWQDVLAWCIWRAQPR